MNEWNTMISTHIVHDGGPSLHGNALENGDHGKGNVVKWGDPIVGPNPLGQAQGARLNNRHILL
jgi:hypothetical protein